MAKISEFENHCWRDIMHEDILQIYKSYERETYVGSKVALLAVDLYNLVYDGGPKPVIDLYKEYPSSCGIHAWSAIKPTVELIETARSLELPIIYSTKKTGTGNNSTFRRRNNESGHSYEIKTEFTPSKQDLVIEKERASCFFGTELADYLRSKGINTIIIFGESTSGCVRATVVDAYSNGFHPVVVEECCFDRSMLSHKVNLFDMHHKYADVMHVHEVKEELFKNNRI
ncbi:isochorismatase family protein [Halalkalibacter okhensis]|uniref:isochorismatase family protein n=1 Tax=Halalkalibacter okhensis TaxID=333138 RepID=UPI00068AC19B|nr:isochorismatase family protein [Halalkalibacter okhensis]